MADAPTLTPTRARFRTLAAEASIPIDADDLAVLARRYAEQGMYDEAIHLYEMAEKLKPGSVALRINLARVRDLKRDAEEARYKGVRQEVLAERARDEIDASAASVRKRARVGVRVGASAMETCNYMKG